jgi:hypothetical protein
MPFRRKFRPESLEILRGLASTARKLILVAIPLSALSSAATIFDSGLVAIAANDATQSGRLNRVSLPSDWSSAKAFPGVVNPTVLYHYDTFVIPTVTFPYIQVTIDDVSGTAQTFASAYLGAYVPNATAPNLGLNTNYLGDAGGSGNYLGGTVPVAFQVVMPVGGTLVLVVNDASPIGAGIGQPFRLLVEGFADTSFSNAPEPATAGLLVAALGVGGLILSRRKKRS